MVDRTYATITAAYWGFTLTDSALSMLVLLHFHLLDSTLPPWTSALRSALAGVTISIRTKVGWFQT